MAHAETSRFIFQNRLECIKSQTRGTKFPSIHILDVLNCRHIVWPDKRNKNKSLLGQSKGQVLTDTINVQSMDLLIHFPTREVNTLDLIITFLPGQFRGIYSPDKVGDHDIVAEILKTFILPKKKPRHKGYQYKKGDCNSMRKEVLNFADDEYFSAHSNFRSAQENVI